MLEATIKGMEVRELKGQKILRVRRQLLKATGGMAQTRHPQARQAPQKSRRPSPASGPAERRRRRPRPRALRSPPAHCARRSRAACGSCAKSGAGGRARAERRRRERSAEEVAKQFLFAELHGKRTHVKGSGREGVRSDYGLFDILTIHGKTTSY